MLDSKIAATVARRHGLTLGDAAALSRLADNEDEANELAGQFAPPVDAESLADEIVRRGVTGSMQRG
jgi:hypothetical protein